MQILLVGEEKSTIKFLAKKVQEQIELSVISVNTLQEIKTKILTPNTKTLVVLNSKNNKKIFDFLTKKNIPTIVTSTLHDKLPNDKDNIIDSVILQSPESLNYIVTLIDRIYKNQTTKVLIVDNLKSDQNRLKSFLVNQLFPVYSASNPLEALQIMEQQSDIKIVITDFKMPLLNGIEFLKIIRRNYSKHHLSVIGISHDKSTSSSFLKHGANDFITKPFNKDELYCRINNSAEALENISKLEEIANRDFLTKVSNRKHFFEKTDAYLKDAHKNNKKCAIAMIDIDNFKSINDTYGHDIGDNVIKSLANILSNNIKGHDIVARFGGEEFVLYIKDVTKNDALNLLENICNKIANHTEIISLNNSLNFTVSIGLVTKAEQSISHMIASADKLLYHAKRSGKNRVISDLVLV